MYTSISSVNI